MIRLASDAELKVKTVNEGRQKIETNFSWNQHIDHWEAIYFLYGKKEY